jgi:DNA-binding CsgD family transcriptional regulator/transcriptional regulator with XRE-family HTH domain
MPDRLQRSSDPWLSEPGDPINAALRAVRRLAGLSLEVLAARTNFSKSYLGNVEAGRRRVTAEIAAAYDTAIGTGGLLGRTLADEPGRLVGRAAELTTVRRLVVEVLAGRGGVVWVEGEPGIGKSALLAAGLAGAAPAGCRVHWAAADESLTRFPLWVLLDGLRDDPDPELATLLRGTNAPGAGDAVLPAAERLVRLVERWCVAGPVVLVVDDLQWADDVSLSVWGRLRRLVSQVRLLLVGACRPVPRRPGVAALRRAVGEPDGVVLRLEPLAAGPVTELTGWLAGAPAGPRLRAAVDQAGGNPLYLREMVEALVREERVRVADGIAELLGPAVPRSLAAAIGARLDFLSERARSVLRIAALLGPEPTVADLSLVAGRSAVELAGIVDEAVAAGVLVAGRDRMAFRHGLIRAALYEETPPSLRLALHQQAAQALAGTGAGVAVVAEQLLAGGATPAWAVDWLAGGAAAALVTRAPQVALDLIERVPDSAGLAGYRIAALSLLGRDEDVARLGPAVLSGTTDVETTGRTAWALAYSLGRLARREKGRAVLAETLRSRELDRLWQARLSACDAVLTVDRADARRALAEAEQADDRFAMAYALHALAVSYHHQAPDEEAALAAIDRALAVIGDRPETADLRALLLSNRVLSMLNLARLAETGPAIGAALAAAEAVGTASRLVLAHSIAATAYYDYGRWDDALAELDVLADIEDSNRKTVWRRRGISALIAVHRDDRAALATHLGRYADEQLDTEIVDLAEIMGLVRIARAYALEATGRPAEAADAALVACLRSGSTPLAPDVGRTCRMEIPAIVRLALTFGRRAEAEAYTSFAVGCAAADPRMETTAIVQHSEGLLAGDADLVAAAVEAHERAGRVPFRAQALEDQAVLLAARGDLAGAGRAYDAVANMYVDLEAAWNLRRAQDRLRQYGLRPSRYRIPRRPTTGWAALTPTELTVAGLVAEGLSNPAIAARLHVSRRTVETHVAHILTKLNARSRAEVARTAAEAAGSP